jgi:hypothetical protein
MNHTTFSLIPHSATYSDYKRARLSEVDTANGTITHRYPSGAVDVRFPGVDGSPALEFTTAAGNLIANKVERAA